MKYLYSFLFTCAVQFGYTQTYSAGNYFYFNGGDIGIGADNGGNARIIDHADLDFNSSEFTIEFWINPEMDFTGNVTGIEPIITKKTSSGSGKGYAVYYESLVSGDFIKFLIRDSDSQVSVKTSDLTGINTQGWVHVAAVVERNSGVAEDSISIYLNGELHEKKSCETEQDLSNTNDFKFMSWTTIGSGFSAAGGSMDDIRIWKTALDRDEINQTMLEPIDESSTYTDRIEGTMTQDTLYGLRWSDLILYLDADHAIINLFDKSLSSFSLDFFSGAAGLGSASLITPLNGVYKSRDLFDAVKDGLWSDPLTWNVQLVPNGDKTIVHIDDYEVRCEGAFNIQSLVVDNNGSLLSNTGTDLSVGGDIYCNGEINMIGGGKVTITRNGNVQIYGPGQIDFNDFVLSKNGNSYLRLNAQTNIHGVFLAATSRIETRNNLTLKSTATNKFGMIDQSGTGLFIGNIKAENYLSSSAGWRQIGMPLSGTLSGFSNINFVLSGGDPKQVNAYYWDNTKTSGDTCTGWTAASLSTASDNALNVYLDPDEPLHSYTNPIEFKGSYTRGNSNYMLTYCDDPGSPYEFGHADSLDGVGWNFIPNNYPRLLDIKAMVADGTFQSSLAYSAAHVWDAGSGQYSATTAGGASIIQYNNVGTAIPVDAVTPFQGLWVKTNSDAEAGLFLSIREVPYTATTASSFGNFLKKSDILRLNVKDHVTEKADQLVIQFQPSSTEGFDLKWDAYKLKSPLKVPTFYTKAGTSNVQINCLPPSDSQMQIFFEPVQGHSSYTISLDEIELDPSWFVYLEDLKTGEITDLRKAEYSFLESEEISTRFILHYSKVPLFENSIACGYVLNRESSGFSISKSNFKGSMEVNVYDLNGRQVDTEWVQYENSVHVSLPKRGFYVVQIKTVNGSCTLKYLH